MKRSETQSAATLGRLCPTADAATTMGTTTIGEVSVVVGVVDVMKLLLNRGDAVKLGLVAVSYLGILSVVMK